MKKVDQRTDNDCLRAWERRGYVHNMGYYAVPDTYAMPAWWGREDVHYSHRSMLWQKSPRDYYGWTGIARVGYVWPVQAGDALNRLRGNE